MSINEFNIQSNSSNSNSFNSIILITATATATTHKTKKFNYICSINPGKLSQISGKITNLANTQAFNTAGRFIAVLFYDCCERLNILFFLYSFFIYTINVR